MEEPTDSLDVAPGYSTINDAYFVEMPSCRGVAPHLGSATK